MLALISNLFFYGRKLREKNRISILLPVLFFILTISFVGSCSPKKISLYEKIIRSRKYSSVFEKNTAKKGVYYGFETRFIVHGTIFTKEFREAFLAEYYNVYYLDEGRKAEIRKYIEAESTGKARFVVALYTSNDRINDLDNAGTVWSVYLVTGMEKKIKPSIMKTVELNEEEIARFFPFGNRYWYRYYDVQFDLGSESRALMDLADPYIKLVFASPVGRAVLVYTP